jgi:hypothetical protein
MQVFETWLHPDRYRTQFCHDGAKCKRKVRGRLWIQSVFGMESMSSLIMKEHVCHLIERHCFMPRAAAYKIEQTFHEIRLLLLSSSRLLDCCCCCLPTIITMMMHAPAADLLLCSELLHTLQTPDPPPLHQSCISASLQLIDCHTHMHDTQTCSSASLLIPWRSCASPASCQRRVSTCTVQGPTRMMTMTR